MLLCDFKPDHSSLRYHRCKHLYKLVLTFNKTQKYHLSNVPPPSTALSVEPSLLMTNYQQTLGEAVNLVDPKLLHILEPTFNCLIATRNLGFTKNADSISLKYLIGFIGLVFCNISNTTGLSARLSQASTLRMMSCNASAVIARILEHAVKLMQCHESLNGKGVELELLKFLRLF